VPPEQFPRQSLGPVPFDGSAHLSCRRDAQSWCAASVLHDEYGHVAAVDACTRIVGTLEFRPPPYPLRPTEGLAQIVSLRRRPSGAYGPWRDGASAQCGRSSSTSAPGSHGFWPGARCSAGRYAYPSSLLPSGPRNGTTHGARVRGPDETSIILNESQNPNPNPGLGPDPGFRVLQSRVLLPPGSGSRSESLRFLPQDFHNCGKRCGKSGRTPVLSSKTCVFTGVFNRRKPGDRYLTGVRAAREPIHEDRFEPAGGESRNFPSY